MSISITPSYASQVRALLVKQPNLTPHEIHQLTGIRLENVKSAMSTKGRDKPKTRAR